MTSEASVKRCRIIGGRIAEQDEAVPEATIADVVYDNAEDVDVTSLDVDVFPPLRKS